MPDWMNYSGWIFGLMGAIGVVQVWLGFTQIKTKNSIEGGSHNTQSGGKGATQNSIKDGNDNSQRG